MPEIRVEIGERKRSYPILIEKGIKEEIGRLLTARYQGDKILLVTDKNVRAYYAEVIEELLRKAGYEVVIYTLPAGEQAKSFKYLHKGYDLLLEKGFNRDNLIMALGGGVVGDLAGFLAATFMRGISFVQIPTTLLAQVDSSVGGKTAINHPKGKNLIGAFYQPELVVIDPDFLQTLPLRELKTGMAEVIKYGLIADRDFALYLKEHKEAIFNLETEPLLHLITRSCTIKAEIVREDEKEKGVRALLNFGHTIGHAIEAVTGYQLYNHGEAVAIGMIGAGRLSCKLGFLTREDLEILGDIVRLYGLPLSCRYGEDVEGLFQTLFYDKKVRDNKLRWILLERLGHAFIKSDIDNQLVREILEGLV